MACQGFGIEGVSSSFLDATHRAGVGLEQAGALLRNGGARARQLDRQLARIIVRKGLICSAVLLAALVARLLYGLAFPPINPQAKVWAHYKAILGNASKTNRFYWDTNRTWLQATERWEKSWEGAANELLGVNHTVPWNQTTVPSKSRPAISRTVCRSTAGDVLIQTASPPEFDIKFRESCEGCRPRVSTAFLIYVHDNHTVHGAERLIHWLYRPDHTFVIHVDGNASDAFNCYLHRRYGELPNVGFARRSNIGWGGWGIVQAELDALYKARGMSSAWNFAINLCGYSLLVKSPYYLDAYLDNRLTVRLPLMASGGESNHTTVRRLSMIPVQEMDPYDKRRPPSDHKYMKKRVPNVTCVEYGPSGNCVNATLTPENKPWYKGGQWKILSKEFVDFVLDSKLSKDWIAFFKAHFALRGVPDESWAQSIFRNSHFRHRVVTEHPMFTWWQNQWCTCGYNNTRPFFSPCYLSGAEFGFIQESPLPFARKFLFNDPVIERIRDELVMPSPSTQQLEQWAYMTSTGKALPPAVA